MSEIRRERLADQAYEVLRDRILSRSLRSYEARGKWSVVRQGAVPATDLAVQLD